MHVRHACGARVTAAVDALHHTIVHRFGAREARLRRGLRLSAGRRPQPVVRPGFGCVAGRRWMHPCGWVPLGCSR